jgi:hypothetical protein
MSSVRDDKIREAATQKLHAHVRDASLSMCVLPGRSLCTGQHEAERLKHDRAEDVSAKAAVVDDRRHSDGEALMVCDSPVNRDAY